MPDSQKAPSASLKKAEGAAHRGGKKGQPASPRRGVADARRRDFASEPRQAIAPPVARRRRRRRRRAVRRRARHRRLHSQLHRPVTEDEKLLQTGQQSRRFHADRSRGACMRIMGEFIEGFDNLADVDEGRDDLRLGAHASGRSAVPGGAGSRAPARRGGLRDHHRRRPGHHGSGEQGRASRAAAARSAATSSCRSSRAPTRTSIRSSTSATSSCGRRCSSNTRTRSSSSPAASARSTKRSRRSR